MRALLVRLLQATPPGLMPRLVTTLDRSRPGRALVDRGVALLVPRRFEIRAGELAGCTLECTGANAGYLFGTAELSVQRTLRERLAPGDVVYDIGANIGFMTLIAARIVGPDGHVYAFEPVPANAELWRRNVAENGLAERATLLREAVAEAPGRASMRGLAYPVSARFAPPGAPGELDVAVTSVDAVVYGRGLPPPRLVKIDVEGSERLALRGMRRTLRERRPVVICEVHGDEPPETVIGELERAGYAVARLPDDPGAALPHYLATPHP